jgi:hypothetical protein
LYFWDLHFTFNDQIGIEFLLQKIMENNEFCSHCESDQMPMADNKCRDCNKAYYIPKQLTVKLAAIACCEEWIEAGMGDKCFWGHWEECPSEYNLTPRNLLKALTEK